MVSDWLDSGDETRQFGDTLSRIIVAKRQNVAGRDGYRILTGNKLPEIPVPEVIQQNHARLKITPHKKSEDALIGLHSGLSQSNEFTEITEPNLVKFVAVNAIDINVTLLDVFVMRTLIDKVADAQVFRVWADDRNSFGRQIGNGCAIVG